jgi:hypothetical protein
LLAFQNETSSFLFLLVLFLLNIATPDIVFDFLHRFPHMATKTDDVLKSNALIRLSTSPQIFPSASQPAFWQQFICSC